MFAMLYIVADTATDTAIVITGRHQSFIQYGAFAISSISPRKIPIG